MKTWGWPQYVMAAFYLIDLVINIAKDGEPRDNRYSGIASLASIVIVYIILRCGGFF